VIVVDTSALMAILLQEPQAAACKAAIVAESHVLISAGTFVEALIVAGHRNLGVEMTALIDGLDFEIEPVTSASARSVSRAYETRGKGRRAPPSGTEFRRLFRLRPCARTRMPAFVCRRGFQEN
jgi:ribonuclease VapC